VTWLNYHHLFYFWNVVQEGGVTAAAKKLRLRQPTVTAQVRALEGALGEKLFRRVGRGLVLTDAGEVVNRYASEIFALGGEMQDALKGRDPGRPVVLLVGVADEVPKLVAYRLLEPALRLPEAVRLVCTEDTPERLVADLASHRLDLVLADVPVGPAAAVRAFNHLLGESDLAFYAAPDLARRLRPGFPASLESAPLLLPGAGTAMGRAIGHWLKERDLRPRVIGEFQDTALMKAFALNGDAVFPAPVASEEDVRDQYHVHRLGRLEGLHQRYYAITVERRIKHPAVAAISEAARVGLLAAGR
jgi:LysR family transcriptional activator of nhaA